MRSQSLMSARGTGDWPRFPVGGWATTAPTLQLWTQIVGKIRLELSPPVNHFWHVPLYVSAHGLTTSPIPYESDVFEIEFDFVDHQLVVTTSWGQARSLPLVPRSVADFYAEVMVALAGLGIAVHIWPMPVEVAEPIRFENDRSHGAYEPDAAHAFWRALIQADRVFKRFRGGFLGKCSPVHFFWGGFDLAVTRFSGRRGPMYTGAALNVCRHVMHESYSHEVSSAGFWPGSDTAPAMFYSYAVPEPAGYRDAAVRPGAASYSSEMGEFVLPYAAVQGSSQPDETLLEFLDSTYAATAERGGWDRELLEERPPCLCDLERK